MKKNEFDSPWKRILGVYLQDFLSLCFPKVADIIDWTKEYTSLEQELRRIVKGATIGERSVDKLMKVWLKSGEEVCIFLHIEVQNRKEDVFPERLFVYYYRLFDHYKKPVITLAVLTDKNKNWRPTHYRHELAGCQVELQFPMVKLLDYHDQKEILERMDNPFSTVILAHLAALETQKDDQSRLQQKLALTRRLYKKGWSKKAIIDFFVFIDYVMALPPEFELQYRNEIEQFEEKENMRYITSIERMGIEKGIEQGIERGIETGVIRGETTMLLRLLRHKFGSLTSLYENKVKEANANSLEHWADRVLDAQTLDDVFRDA
jgi:hypothetical protein